jgi:hypothetical protein
MGHTDEQQTAQAAAVDAPEQNETGPGTPPVVTAEESAAQERQEDLKAFKESFEAHAKSVKWMLKEHPRSQQLIDRLMEKLTGIVEDYIMKCLRPEVHHFTKEQIENSLAPEITTEKTYDNDRQRPQQ